VTTWLARRSQFHQSVLVAHVTPYSPQARQFLTQAREFLLHSGSDWNTASRRAPTLLYGMIQRQAALLSFIEVFRIMGFLFLATVPLVLLMRKPAHRDAAPASH
jgi:DHA2 family multidrug resistance protein